ncbi:MAG: hypothetical protein C4K60_04945 [Ideonella sp. MAG2]|nr:MAG: hypothetical protein C4K60_04945 [Ideonella sp. MAG2]
MWRALSISVLLSLAGLAGCGGGGGDSASTGGGGAQPPLADSVRLSNVRTKGTAQTTYVSNLNIGDLSVTVDVTGDLTRLSGQTLYVIVEDVDQLFLADATLRTSVDGLNNELILQGSPTAGRQGRYKGPVKIRVCTDVACTVQLGNSPITVPYDIEVREGLAFTSKAPLVVEADFGVIPEDVVISYSAPAAADVPSSPTLFAILPGTPPSLDLQDKTPKSAVVQSDPAKTVRVSLGTAPVGTRTIQVGLSTRAPTEAGTVTLNAATEITYVVRPVAGKVAVFDPNTVEISTVASPIYGGQFSPVKVLSADGKRYSSVSRVEYLARSPSGNLDAGALQWVTSVLNSTPSSDWTQTVQLGGTACPGNIMDMSRPCLAPGRYDALVYLKTEDGLELTAPVPVSMTVRLQLGG